MITMQSNPIWFFTLFLLLPCNPVIPLLLATPRTAHPVVLQACAFCPSPKCFGRSMVRLFHASDRACRLHELAADLPGYASASHPLYLHWIFAGTCFSHVACWFENLVLGDKAHLKIGSFHHQLHHRYFECNYGGPEMPWDNWFGSFHDGSPEATQRVRETKKRMHTK